MKIGDEVYIHGYVDEIRNNTVIIRNKGGYFGTVLEEIKPEFTSGYITTDKSIEHQNKLTSWTTASCTKGKWADNADKTCQFCMYYFEGKGCQNSEMYHTDCSWV
ncbi:MAG: hypothetical protein IJH55_09395 [Romboutsia sp.]|nr:hypothetical protein [Romboutsia sp.]